MAVAANPSPTERLRLEKQTVDSNENAWGTRLNSSLDLVDAGFAVLEIAVEADVTLTAQNYTSDQSRAMCLILSGSGGFDVLHPASTDKPYMLINNCTADVDFGPDGQTLVTVRAGFMGWYYTNEAGTVGYLADMTLDKIKAPAAAVDVNSQKITSLADAVDDTDAMNKQSVTALTASSVAAAAASASAASGSASSASTSATNASNAQTYAEEWANKAEDSLVSAAAGGDEATEYSALHWAAKAADSAAAAAIFDPSSYAAKAGTTFTGEVVMSDQLLTRALLKDYGEEVNAIGSIGGGTQDIDLTLGNVVTGTVDTSTTTFTFSNPTATGDACSFTLILTNGGSQTINWPASVDWAAATAPTLTASGVDVLVFTTLDGGTTWLGFTAGLEMS